MSDQSASDFERAAAEEGSFIGEFWQFLNHTKKWWLLPILVVLLLFAVLAWMGSSAAAPFIYTLF